MLSFLIDVVRGRGAADFGAYRSWYIICIRPSQEKKVHEGLVQRGIESFQPMVVETRQWSDRTKKVEVPLFPGYGFVHITAQERLRVLRQRGVVEFLAVDRHPAVVSDEEIRSLQLAVDSSAHLYSVDMPRGGEVTIVQEGPLEGIRGIVMRPGETTHLVIPIESMHKAVAVDVDAGILNEG